jgi:FKBP-type peptidyl-prolyl cis-trans isomerase FklB
MLTRAGFLFIVAFLAACSSTGVSPKDRNFLDKNKARSKVKVSPSGLQYEILAEGFGDQPAERDEVVVRYTGRFTDGEVFDDSDRHGGTVRFGVTSVIRGWTEALLRMRPGARWKIVLPPEIAYGDRGFGPVPPNAVLEFEIELVEVTQR